MQTTLEDFAEILIDGKIYNFTKEEYARYLVDKHLKNCEIIYVEKADYLGLSVQWNNSDRKLIKFNKIAKNLFTFSEWKQLVLHEVAHHLVPHSSNHDYKYQKKAMEIGVNFENTTIKFKGAPFWKVAVAIDYNKRKRNV